MAPPTLPCNIFCWGVLPVVRQANSIVGFNKPANPSFPPQGGLQHLLTIWLLSKVRVNCALRYGCSLSGIPQPSGAPACSQMPDPWEPQDQAGV